MWRGDQQLTLSAPVMLVTGGLIVNHDFVISRFDTGGADLWPALLRKEGAIQVSAAQASELIAELLRLSQVPRLALPPELEITEVVGTPLPRFKLKLPAYPMGGNQALHGELSFTYESTVIPADDPQRGIYQAAARRWLLRDHATEQAAATRLKELGVRYASAYYNEQAVWKLTPKNLPRVVRTLVSEGWQSAGTTTLQTPTRRRHHQRRQPPATRLATKIWSGC